MYHVSILGIGGANPTHILPQSDAKQFAMAMFGDAIEDIDRLMPLFQNTQIQQRHISQPLEWYGRSHSFLEANALYEEVALDISTQAAAQAIANAKVEPSEIGAILFVSSTGIVTPSLDVGLIQRLQLSPHISRVPIWGLGCAGGVSGLARASEIASMMPERAVLLVATELCSLTFQRGDMSKANLVAVSLFGDGAAAIVLRANPNEANRQLTASLAPTSASQVFPAPFADAPTPVVMASHSTLFPETEYVMGWDLTETGLKVRFDRSIPSLVLEHLQRLVEESCKSWGLNSSQIKHCVVHPGGARVLDAYAQSLQISPERLRHAHLILEKYGNMSSPTVFFVLQEFLKDIPPSGEYGIMLAWGPGFSAEQLLFRW